LNELGVTKVMLLLENLSTDSYSHCIIIMTVSLAVSTKYTNVTSQTDSKTPYDSKGRAYTRRKKLIQCKKGAKSSRNGKCLSPECCLHSRLLRLISSVRSKCAPSARTHILRVVQARCQFLI